jgi:hypothetical protein
LLHNPRETRSRAQNWSVNVFFYALTDLAEEIFFAIFPEKFSPNFELSLNFIKFGQHFDFWTIFFQKNREKYFLWKISRSIEKHAC